MSPYIPNHEPVVKISTPLPKGYVFVPKGNVYITGNCRRLTLAAGEKIYAVINQKRQSVGIRVPASVHSQVLEDERDTRADRASIVQKRDATLEKQFRDAIVQQFPQMPASTIPLVVKRAMLKGSRRVGRTGKLDIETKALLAVRAHIRHTHTNYDDMLRKKTHSKGKARDEVLGKIDELVKSWGGKVDEKRRARSQKNKKKKKKDRKPKENGKEKEKSQDGGKKTKCEAKSAAAKQGPGGKEGVAGQKKHRMAKDMTPMKMKKIQVRLARQEGSTTTKPQIGKSLRHYSLDSDDDMDDESDEFEWRDSDSDSDSEWTPDN